MNNNFKNIVGSTQLGLNPKLVGINYINPIPQFGLVWGYTFAKKFSDQILPYYFIYIVFSLLLLLFPLTCIKLLFHIDASLSLRGAYSDHLSRPSINLSLISATSILLPMILFLTLFFFVLPHIYLNILILVTLILCTFCFLIG